MEFDIKKLLDAEQEARKNLEAIVRVKKLMGIEDTVRVDARQFELVSPSSPDEDDLDEAPLTSLRGKIEQVVNSDASIKWTTQKVLAHLQQSGYPLKAKKPIYSVGQSLQKLAQGDRIRLVRKGVGSAPNIYRAKLNEKSDSEAGSEGEYRTKNLELQ